MKAWGVTNRGMVRSQNQDAYYHLVEGKRALLLVCDGMGGARAGNIASRLAAETFVDTMRESKGQPARQRLTDALAAANQKVYRTALEDKECFGMGTTLVAALVEGPFIASHSNAAALVPTERNLSDDQIREIVGRGGFIGMNAMNFLVHERDGCETIAALVDHIDHIVGLGGGDCVGFGFDFNDQILKYIPEDELRLVPRVCRDVVHGHGEVPLVLDELRRRGYREEQVEKIVGGNFLRVLRENLS